MFYSFQMGGMADSTSSHSLKNHLRFLVYVIVVVRGATPERAGNDGGQASALFSRESYGGFMKMALGGGFDAEHAWPPFNDVQVQFENPFLGQPGFQHPGDKEFLQFSNRIPGGREK